MTTLYLNLELLAHDTGRHHPERPERLRAIAEAVDEDPWLSRLQRLTAGPASMEDMLRVHDEAYLRRLERACQGGERFIDTPECPLCPRTFEIARLAAGGVLAAVEAVAAGRAANAFCAVRPPGHHAERDRAMGFCYLNNVAIAARWLRERGGFERALIFDWDVHHGNGTQHAFEKDPSVFFCSIHEDPRYLYPGTGFAEEVGREPGRGTTLNLPMLPGSSDEDYRRILTERFLPAARSFRPDFILVSAGFDAHAADPLAHIELSTEAFARMTRMVRELAAEICEGRLVSVLEGGYNLEALQECVTAHLHALAGERSVEPSER